MARTPSFRGKRSRGPTRIKARFGDRTLYLTPREARFVRERAGLYQAMIDLGASLEEAMEALYRDLRLFQAGQQLVRG